MDEPLSKNLVRPDVTSNLALFCTAGAATDILVIPGIWLVPLIEASLRERSKSKPSPYRRATLDDKADRIFTLTVAVVAACMCSEYAIGKLFACSV